MKKNIKFDKYHATGNDFIIIDDTDERFNMNQPEIELLCHRRFGIGADGVILLQKSKIANFKMKYYNSDGNPGTFCGNGSRCISAYAYKNNYAESKMLFEASDGLHKAEVLENGDVSVLMNPVDEILEYSDGYFLNTGSPHFVKIVNNIDEIDVFKEGRAISKEERFYEASTNVNFLEVESSGIKLATYERGVEDETFSCGTGAIASAIVFSRFFFPEQTNIRISTKGGFLRVSFKVFGQTYSEIRLTGPAVEVFSGKYNK
jgi:diaminopimelate epimerase